MEGVNYLYVKKSGLYFVCTSKFNVSPSFVMELIGRCTKVFKDYCGVMTEESIRKNFILLYELLDEMVVRSMSSPVHPVVLYLPCLPTLGWSNSHLLGAFPRMHV